MAELLALDEAVARFVGDGDTVAMEGFTHLIPHAAGHEVIRQAKRALTLYRMTPDMIYDQLIGMGCASKLVFSWGGNPGVGSLLITSILTRDYSIIQFVALVLAFLVILVNLVTDLTYALLDPRVSFRA